MEHFPVFFISGLFILIALVMNEKNARYLLAGYNTMPEKDRKNFDIKGFIGFFKKFFFILGIAILIIYCLMEWLGFVEYEFIITIVLPVISVFYLPVKAQGYYIDRSVISRSIINYVGIGILGLATLGSVFLFYLGLSQNDIKIENKCIKISGMYSEEISFNTIRDIELTDELPVITQRTNGFAFAGYRKGCFTTQNGEKIKLYVNRGINQYLKIVTNDQTCFWNSKSEDMVKVLEEIKNHLK